MKPRKLYGIHPKFWIRAVVLGAALLVFLWIRWALAPANALSHRFFYVKVLPGQSAGQIAETLKHKGIIRSALAFQVMSRFDNLSRTLKSGVYRLSPRDTLTTILQSMRSGNVVVIKVSIPEGFTVHQIIQRLLAHHIGTAQQYQNILKSPLPGMPKPAAGVRDPYEGYLLPATYSFPWGTTAEQAIHIMWDGFQERAIRQLYQKSHSRLSLTEWVTLASIVQQEAKRPADSGKIARVFLNRIQAHMPFQSDATVRYAMGQAIQGGLTLKDLSFPSPYNTYQHTGLPPGPISCPGLFVLKQTLHPPKVPYLYFLSLRNGRILYATTYAQHLANIRYADTHPHG